MAKLLLSILLIFLTVNIVKSEDKIPLYLSIEAYNPNADTHVYNFVYQSMIQLIKEYPSKTIIQDFNSLFGKYKDEDIFHEPDSWHTTCLYIGNDPKKLETDIYKNFKENEAVSIRASTFVYIPKKIMCTPVFFDDFKLIENKYPHVTLLLGSYSAVDSNFVLTSIFDNQNYLASEYNTGKIKDFYNNKIWRFKDVLIDFGKGKTETVEEIFIVKTGNVLNLDAKTKRVYTATNNHIQ